MTLSVITTIYDRPDHLRLFLAALAGQTRRPDEIIVADDGSSPETAAVIAALAKQCNIPIHVVRQENTGFRAAAARNMGIRRDTGDYLVFLDCDIAILPDTLATHERLAGPGRLLCSNRALLSADATAALFAQPQPPSPEEWAALWKQADHSEWQLAARVFDRHAAQRRWHIARPHKPKLLGCHFSLPRGDVYAINGFDENYIGWGYEDDDFVRRLYKTRVVPVNLIRDAKAVHLWHPSLAPDDKARHQHWPNRAYFRRWRVPAYCEKGLQ